MLHSVTQCYRVNVFGDSVKGEMVLVNPGPHPFVGLRQTLQDRMMIIFYYYSFFNFVNIFTLIFLPGEASLDKNFHCLRQTIFEKQNLFPSNFGSPAKWIVPI